MMKYKKCEMIMWIRKLIGVLVFCAFLSSGIACGQSNWPDGTRESKPWTRWWWMGNAVDKEGIRSNLVDLSNAGIGGVEIVPIYGAKGYEDKYIDFLSPKWIEMMEFTVDVADNLGMGVDMTMGTGWPFGGPQVEPHLAASKLIIQKYEAAGNTEFEKDFVIEDKKQLGLAELQYVLAFSKDGGLVDLTSKLMENRVKWNSPDGDHTVYAIFCGKSRQKVKRASPGGEGYVLDHFSAEAFEDYARPFKEALADCGSLPRAMFNDSYEVYSADYSAKLFEEFQARRGYDLKQYIPELTTYADSDKTNRIMSDYRQTLADMLYENFARPWTGFANNIGMKTKYQAHGSPGNLLDLYASASIPECETYGGMAFDIPGLRRQDSDTIHGEANIMMLKFASSAGHIAGRPKISSESLTWLRDHFKGALSQAKPEMEGLFLAGVNHVFFHGTTYSPKDAPWPGWKFYAATNMHPNNTIWKDAPELFKYIERCQSVLQVGSPDNELLLYWPVYDQWAANRQAKWGGKVKFLMQIALHETNSWLYPTSFYKTANLLVDNGYDSDFISENFIMKAKVVGGEIEVPGGKYKALIVPDCKYMPVAVAKKLDKLRKTGAKIIFVGLPESVPGLHEYKQRETKLLKLQSKNSKTFKVCGDLIAELSKLPIAKEQLADHGLKYIRRKSGNDRFYYIVNHSAKAVDEYVKLGTSFAEAIIMDPMTGKEGYAKVSKGKVRISIKPGESLIIKTTLVIKTMSESSGPGAWKYLKAGKEYDLKGKWQIDFLEATPYQVNSVNIDELTSWTSFSKEAQAYSGTARYTIEFDKPKTKADAWLLKLGDVRESARVTLNGEYVGCVWANPFEINIGQLRPGKNKLQIEVTNLAANRIRDLEKSGKEWKNFHNINIVNMKYRKFDATKWEPMPSGLLGPVKLQSVSHE